jgi:hypothetical protein
MCPGRTLKGMAGTTRLELATSAVTVQRPEVTVCNFTAPIATLGALRNSREVLLHPSCTQIRRFSVLGVELLYWRQRRRVLLGGRWVEPSDSECCSGTDRDDIMISYGKRRRRGPVCRTKYRERR